MAIAELLLLPVMAPVWGVRFVLERLRDEADAVQHDERRTFVELIELSRRRNTGEISETEFAEQETALLERLRTIREHRTELPVDEMDADDGVLDAEAESIGEEW